MSRLHRQELQAAFEKIKAAVDEFGRLIESTPKADSVRRQVPDRRELCREILKASPGLNIYELIDEMRKRGYLFRSRSPVNSIRPMLYKASEFTCTRGRFFIKPVQ